MDTEITLKSNSPNSLNKHTNPSKTPAIQPEIKAFMEIAMQKKEEASIILAQMAKAACGVQAAKESLEEDIKYVVDLGENAKKAIANGDIKFDRDKKGRMYAQVRRSNGEYGKKFSIKEEITSEGIDPSAALIAMQTEAIQQQLEEVLTTLQEIGNAVSDIKQGQQDDRYGLLLGGQSLYLESTRVNDPTLQKLLEAQALKSLSDASGQLTQSAKSAIAYLAEGQYNKLPRGKKKAADDKIQELRQNLEAVNATFAMKAAIYYNAGEVDAMLATFEQYSNFISATVAPKAKRLAELDEQDHLPQGGFWEEKAKELVAVDEMRKLLDVPDDVLLLDFPAKEVTNEQER